MNPVLHTKVFSLLEQVSDPEIPVLSIIDLGIVRGVQETGDQLEVTITPTYSGCPAMKEIENQIKTILESAGYKTPVIKTVLSPAWTTDWLSEAGQQKLFQYGIAPPVKTSADKRSLFTDGPRQVRCPHCKSVDTIMKSQFGSTACKALYVCNACLEPFDYFKCI